MTERICSACFSTSPSRLTRLIAATVRSTASLIALSAQAIRCAPCICSANSAIRRCSSSGSPNRSPKPPSMGGWYRQPAATLRLMSPMVEAAGVELAYRELGEGDAVLLVHGMADDAAGWEDVVDALSDRARVIAYDRRGYGRSGAPDPYQRTTVQEQAQDAAALLRALDAS